jgi:hypothetical protein
MSLNNVIVDYFNISNEYIVIFAGLLLYYFHFLSVQKFIFTNIIITCFVLACYETFLKKILLFNVDNDYYKFIINNAITIVVIDLLINLIKYGFNNDKYDVIYYFNIAFSCIFYETIVYKLFNYNNLYNSKLRSITKTIMRLATIAILSIFLSDSSYDKDWFDLEFGKLFNFLLFNCIFEN